MTTVPSVRFALPGRWVKAELDDPAAVSALVDLLPDREQKEGAWLESLRAAGAQTVLLRPSSTPPAAVLFVWPPEESRGDPSPEALQARLGLRGEIVQHESGYATVRERRTSGGSHADVVTYALSHPDTGRVLVVRCTGFGQPFEDYMIRDFDLAAARLTWVDA